MLSDLYWRGGVITLHQNKGGMEGFVRGEGDTKVIVLFIFVFGPWKAIKN